MMIIIIIIIIIIQRHGTVCSQLHVYNMQGNRGTIETTNTRMTMYKHQSKQVMKVRIPYYGTNECESAEIFLTINRTS